MNFLDEHDRFEKSSQNRVSFVAEALACSINKFSKYKRKSVAESNLINFSREHEKPNRMLQQPEPIN